MRTIQIFLPAKARNFHRKRGVMSEQSFCHHHFDREAVGIGSRCGHFLCGECLLDHPHHCCIHCKDWLKAHNRLHGISAPLLIALCAFSAYVMLSLRHAYNIAAFTFFLVFLFVFWLQQYPLPRKAAGREDEPQPGPE